MKKCLLIFIILSSCSSSSKLNYKVLSNVICDVIGDDYYYESYATFCERKDTFDVAYSFYEQNREKVNEPIVFFINRLKQAGISDDNNKEALLNVEELKLFEKLMGLSCGINFDVNRLAGECDYKFKLATDNKINSIKPSERVVFRISRIAFSDNKKLACFFIEGGRGADGYWDSIIFVIENHGIWNIINKIPIRVY